MKLYYFPPSSNSRRAQAVAIYLQLPIDLHLIDLQQGEQQNAGFLKLNPTGRIPVLTDSDFILWESNAIMQYLASQIPNSLWPNNPIVRADISRWQCWQLAHWSKGCQPLQFERFVKKVLQIGDPDPAVEQHAIKCFHKEATVLNDYLASHQYLVGDSLTLADFSVASDLTYSAIARFPLAQYPYIQSWYAQIEALPAWKATDPTQQH